MKRWIAPIVGIVALAAVAILVTGCETEQADTTVATPVTEAAPDTATPAAHDVVGEYTYTCPMHPDVKQDRPGKCPECGMFLVADTDADVEYYCPMHEHVVEDDPGKCPECGMFLEARPVENGDDA